MKFLEKVKTLVEAAPPPTLKGDLRVQKFIKNEMQHLNSNPELKELSERLALKLNVKPGQAQRYVLEVLLDALKK